MRPATALALLLLLACHPNPGEAREAAMTKDDLVLDWKMTLVDDGHRLRIDYTVTNRGKQRIYLLDQLVAEKRLQPEATIVRNADAPQTVAFVRALEDPDGKVHRIVRPGARPVEPGKQESGVSLVDLPLHSWHNFGSVAPLKDVPTQAVLVVGYILDPGPDGFDEMQLEGGGVVKVPKTSSLSTHASLKSPPQPLPRK
jgi:hypothetical protein